MKSLCYDSLCICLYVTMLMIYNNIYGFLGTGPARTSFALALEDLLCNHSLLYIAYLL